MMNDENDQGAGLIGQTIPELVETEPLPNRKCSIRGGCHRPVTREFCYAGEPWMPYCDMHTPQYETAGKRRVDPSAPPATTETLPHAAIAKRIIDAIPGALGMTPDPWPDEPDPHDGEPHRTVAAILSAAYGRSRA